MASGSDMISTANSKFRFETNSWILPQALVRRRIAFTVAPDSQCAMAKLRVHRTGCAVGSTCLRSTSCT